MKVGKAAALAIGGGVILIQIAHEQGLIKVDWNKVTRKIDSVQDKVEEAVTGQGPTWMDKVCCTKCCIIFDPACSFTSTFLSL